MRQLTIFSFIFSITAPVFAQMQKPASRFSHKGFKVSGGLGGFENDFDEFGGKLDSGGAGFLPTFTISLSTTSAIGADTGTESPSVSFCIRNAIDSMWIQSGPCSNGPTSNSSSPSSRVGQRTLSPVSSFRPGSTLRTATIRSPG